MKTKFAYDKEAARLAKAIDLAIAALQKYPPPAWTTQHLAHFTQVYTAFRSSVLNPSPKLKKAGYLNQLMCDVFTYFQEGVGEGITYFWQQVEKEKLGYVREDKLRKIMSKSRLKNREEYEYLTDVLVAAGQEGRITTQQAQQLSEMIGEFEKRKTKA